MCVLFRQARADADVVCVFCSDKRVLTPMLCVCVLFRQARADADVVCVFCSDKRVLTPMTREEWEKTQRETRRVFDADTGRWRCVRRPTLFDGTFPCRNTSLKASVEHLLV